MTLLSTSDPRATAAQTDASHTPTYEETLQVLSDGSVHRSFAPFVDIDWDAPENRLDPMDRRWILHPSIDPLGATDWYQAQPEERRIEIGRWRQANAIRVGAAFESVLIRGLMHYITKLPNNSAEYRYALHEMAEECNHMQMFQELVNRMGADVPGMRPMFRRLAPWTALAGGYFHIILVIGILGGEEPIDHYQKSLLRSDVEMPPLVRRVMEIHIAEEARHISFAGEFLRERIPQLSKPSQKVCAIAFPLAMRWLAGEIMTPPKEFARRFDIPDEVMREAFWRSAHSRAILASYFDDMRTLATDLGLMTPTARRLWRRLGIDGRHARYRSEPDRTPALSVSA